MPNDITFSERFQRWSDTHSKMLAVYAQSDGAIESFPDLLQDYERLVTESFELALDVIKAPARSSSDIEAKKRVWDAEEACQWGAEEIRECMQQVMADAVELAK